MSKIKLCELIESLRQEFQLMSQDYQNKDILFLPTSIEIEACVAVERERESSGGLNIWVLDLEGKDSVSSQKTQKVKVQMSIRKKRENGNLDDLVFGDS